LAQKLINISEVLSLDDLIKSEDAFFAATGITQGGSFLEGVHFDRGGVTTHSLAIRALTQSVRYIKGIHQLDSHLEFGNRKK